MFREVPGCSGAFRKDHDLTVRVGEIRLAGERVVMAAQHETSTFGAVTLAAYAAGAPPVQALVLGLFGGMTSDWPDIDAASSRIVHVFWWAPWFPLVLKHVSALVFDLCATPVDRARVTTWTEVDGKKKTKVTTQDFRIHRGFWHSVWGALVTALVWWGLLTGLSVQIPVVAEKATAWFGMGPQAAVLIAVAMGAGMVGHILGDSCTDFGTSPLAPVVKWRGHRYPPKGLLIEPLRFKTGKEVEEGLIAPLCWALAGWGVAGVWSGPWTLLGAAGAAAGAGWGWLVAMFGKRKAKKIVNAVLEIATLGLAVKKRRRRSTRRKPASKRSRSRR